MFVPSENTLCHVDIRFLCSQKYISIYIYHYQHLLTAIHTLLLTFLFLICHLLRLISRLLYLPYCQIYFASIVITLPYSNSISSTFAILCHLFSCYISAFSNVARCSSLCQVEYPPRKTSCPTIMSTRLVLLTGTRVLVVYGDEEIRAVVSHISSLSPCGTI